MTERPRVPVGLTIATLVAMAILIGLGTWQLRRLAWKTDMLARIEALQHAPAQPLAAVLARARRGQNVEFTRVVADCPGLATARFEQVYAVVDGGVVARLVSACPLEGDNPGDAILVDRGYLLDTVSARPPVSADRAPVRVTGVLRKGDAKAAKLGQAMASTETAAPAAQKVWYGRNLADLAAALGVTRPAPYFLMAETSSNPELGALTPKGVPTDIPNNHLSYAITWFGLAAALAGVYAALLRRKMKGR